MQRITIFLLSGLCVLSLVHCSQNSTDTKSPSHIEKHPQTMAKLPVILDTDANNELDDQHAIAYLLFNGDVFDVEGITVNRTYNGGTIDEQLMEAKRVMELCQALESIPLKKGADKAFDEIEPHLSTPDFDGAEAVDFIIRQAEKERDQPLILLPIGKLTNIALALKKAPHIAENVRVVWLGSNYPEPGEYNQNNDTAAMSFLLQTDVPFEIVTVRYGKPSGTDAVRATPDEIQRLMTGKGPKISPPVTGRHGKEVSCFGDYSINLFEHIDLHGDPPSRALFDMAAVAIVKNPLWASARKIPAPRLSDNTWIDQPTNRRMILLWEDFDRDKIMEDFYDRMDNFVMIGSD
ncbi:MAG: nucleoside hydrolase [Bacteroidota bacterium]